MQREYLPPEVLARPLEEVIAEEVRSKVPTILQK